MTDTMTSPTTDPTTKMIATDSIKAMRTAALFGIDLDEPYTPGPGSNPAPDMDTSAITESIMPGRILHITGPSGSGKSTLLRELVASLEHRGDTVINA